MTKINPNRNRAHSKGQNSLIEEAYRKIKHLIFLQQLVPGQRLIYDDLAKLLNMSRTPIINALNRLEQQGLVVSESFRGFQVRPMDTQEAWDAFGMREALETYAVKQAIEHATGEDFRKLEEKLEAHESYVPNYYDRKKIQLDAQFHIQIAAMSGNRILKWHLRTNLEHLYLRADLSNYNVDRMAVTPTEHRQLLNRMKNKDTLGSIELITLHIRKARDHVITCLSEQEFNRKMVSL